MLSGGLGQPTGGFPPDVVKAVLGTARPKKPALPRINLEKTREEVAAKSRRPPSDDDLYSHLMYPQVFASYVKKARDYGDLSVLPTPAFFYGLSPGEEVSVDIEEGKTLFIKLIHVGAPNSEGRRALSYELNGMPRESSIVDRSITTAVKSRVKADPANPNEIGAPIPGMVTALHASVGSRVASGDKLATLEAMKMQTTIYAPAGGIVDEVFAAVGDSLDSRDLLVRLR
jgi:pyruvate carboxylase